MLAQTVPATGPADAPPPATHETPAAGTPAAATPAAVAPADSAAPAATAPSVASPAAATVDATRPASPAAAGTATAPSAAGGTIGPATGPSGTAAPTGPTATQPSGSAIERLIGNFNPIFLVVIAVGVMMFFQMRTRRNNEKAQKERLNSIKRGDRVQTIGGILGNVVQTEEKRILVKVDESNNTKIWFARDAIRGVLEEEKPDAKAGR